MAETENKNTKQLRREVEILKAQLKTDPNSNISSYHYKQKEISTKSNEIVIDNKLIKKDFTKTIILSLIAFAIIIGLKVANINP